MLVALRELVAEDARRCRLAPRAAWSLLAAPIVVAVLFTATALHRPTFEWLTQEDGLLEWTQFGCFAAAGAAGLVATARLRSRDRVAAILLAGFTLVAVFAAGEEISWGQRIFGWGTPEALEEINHQGETTVHNIMPVQTTFNYVQLLAGLLGGAVAVVLRRRWRSRPLAADVVLPVSFLASGFLAMAGYRLVRLTVLTEDRFVFVKYGEMVELLFAAAVLGTGVMVARQARTPLPGASPLPVQATTATAVDHSGARRAPRSRVD